MMIYILDNFDSFTYNLVHYITAEGAQVLVERNDEIDFSNIELCDKIVLSPGPGLPVNAGGMMELIQKYVGVKPIFGVCLGHQAIAEHFGWRLRNLNEVFHGVDCTVSVDSSHYLFNGVPTRFRAGRYHSWVVDNASGIDLDVTAVDEEGDIMALAHSYIDICGVQFHPESVMTEFGRDIIKNWLNEKGS